MYAYWKMIFIFYYILMFILTAHGLPTNGAKEDVNCLILSPEIENQINEVTYKIAAYITEVSKEYDDIDLRLINVNIDRHSALETNKTSVFVVNINDCTTNNTYTTYNNLKNVNNKTAKDTPNKTDVKPIDEDSIDFDDLDDDDIKDQTPKSDEYSFVGDTEFISTDRDDEYIINYQKNEHNNITENNDVKFTYYYNYNDIKNNNVTWEKVINVY